MEAAFRTDGNLDIGSGHVIRCLTLANALRDRGVSSTFYFRHTVEALVGAVKAAGHQTVELLSAPRRLQASADLEQEDAERFLGALSIRKPGLVVVDNYQLGLAWEVRVAKLDATMLAIDDLGRPHASDVVLDQNAANPCHDRYRTANDARRTPATLLLGPSYALVRPEFRALRCRTLAGRSNRTPRTWLIFMSGSDPGDETSRALAGIMAVMDDSWRVDVVIGAIHPRRDAIASVCRSRPALALHIDTANMANLMATADCAIGSAGSATWERCVLGLPAIVTILAPNQEGIGTAVAAEGGHYLLAERGGISGDTYAAAVRTMLRTDLGAMASRAASICDGFGAPRVARYLSDHIKVDHA